MIFSEKCIDETAGFDKDYDKGTLVPRKYGRYVLTVEECDAILSNRKPYKY